MPTLRLRFFSWLAAGGIVAGCAVAGPIPGPGGGGAGAYTDTKTAGGPADGWTFPSDATDVPPTGSGGSGHDSTCTWPQSPPLELMDPQPGALHAGPYARAHADLGVFPRPGTVELGQLLAYYPVAPAGADLGMTASLEELDNGKFVLQVVVQTPVVPKHAPLAMAIVVDTSASMMGAALDRARASAEALVHGLLPGDGIAVLTTSRKTVVAPGMVDSEGLVKAADAARAIPFDAGEDLSGAIEDAYAMIDEMRKGGLSAPGRVVLITDGAASDVSIPLDKITDGRSTGTLLAGVGVGDASTYDVSLLDMATYNGGGPLLFVDSEAEAIATLTGRFDELFTGYAPDLKVTVDLPQGVRLVVPPNNGEGSALQVMGGEVGPGRSIVFRRTLETCHDLSTFELSPVSLSVWANGGTGPKFEGAFKELLASNITDLEAQLLLQRTALIVAYADALESLDRVQFKAVLDLAEVGLAIKADDPTFGAIRDLAQRDYDLLVPGGK